jgi:tricorn protease-like protein
VASTTKCNGRPTAQPGHRARGQQRAARADRPVQQARNSWQFVTSDRYTSGSPFSPDGKWLYFLSARNFQLANGSPWGDRNMGPVFDKRVGVYALALQPGNRFPFQPDDELSRR